MSDIYWEPHQFTAWDSRKRIILLVGGIQGGKTMLGSHWIKRKVHENNGLDNYLVCAPSYKIFNQATMPAFMRVFSNMGQYNKQDQEFRLNTGGRVYFRTATHPWAVEGITNLNAIWCDEAGMYSLLFWDNVLGRSAFRRSPIMVTTTPYAVNWLAKLVQDVKTGRRDDCEYIPYKSIDSKYFPKEEYERQRGIMDPRRFKMKYEGSFEAMVGLVYDCMRPEYQIESHQLPPNTRYFAGIDWGYTAPFAMSIRAVLPNRDVITVSEHYQTGLTTADKVRVAKAKKSVFGIERFFCDPEDPSSIEEFNRNGLNAAPVELSGKKRLYIDTHYELIKSGKWKIFADQCPNTIDEYSTYRYPDETDTGYNRKEDKDQLPLKLNDHLMDAEMYVTVGTNNLWKFDKITAKKTSYEDTHGLERIRRYNKRRRVHDEEG